MHSTKLLTADQLADYLNTSPNTVRRLTREGELPWFKLGSEYRYDLTAVREAMAVAPSRPLAEAVCELIGRTPGEDLHDYWLDVAQGLDPIIDAAVGVERNFLIELYAQALTKSEAYPCQDEGGAEA